MPTLWVTWGGSKVAHAADRAVKLVDVRSGSFPLACGRFAPDGWDKNLREDVGNYKPRCKRCVKAVASGGH
jgi:hypothetical protein